MRKNVALTSCTSTILISFALFLQKAIRVMMGLEYPEVTADDEEWETLINESTYSNTKDDKEKNKLWH